MRKLAVLSGVLLLLGCSGDSKEDKVNPLPAVAFTEVADLVICHDWNGVKPDREYRPARFPDIRPHYCYVGDVCFFNCPAGM